MNLALVAFKTRIATRKPPDRPGAQLVLRVPVPRPAALLGRPLQLVPRRVPDADNLADEHLGHRASHRPVDVLNLERKLSDTCVNPSSLVGGACVAITLSSPRLTYRAEASMRRYASTVSGPVSSNARVCASHAPVTDVPRRSNSTDFGVAHLESQTSESRWPIPSDRTPRGRGR